MSRVLAVVLALTLMVTALRNSILQGPIFSVVSDHAQHLFLLALFLVLIACWAVRPRDVLGTVRANRFLFVSILLYGIVVAVSSIAGTPEIGADRAIEIALVPLNFLVYCLVLPRVLGERDYRLLFKILIAFFCLSALLTFNLMHRGATSLWGIPLALPGDHRGGKWAGLGVFHHRNTIGSFLEFFPAIAVYLGLTEGRWKLWGPVAALLALNIILTFSRSSQIVMLISFIPVILIGFAKYRRTALIALGTIAAVLLALFLGGLSNPEESVFFRFARLGFGLEGRESYWTSLLERVREHPWLGFGLYNISFSGESAHNAYLTQLGYFGILGALAFALVFLALIWKAVLRVLRGERALSSYVLPSLLFGVSLQGLVEYMITHAFFFTNSFYLLVFGYVIGARKGER